MFSLTTRPGSRALFVALTFGLALLGIVHSLGLWLVGAPNPIGPGAPAYRYLALGGYYLVLSLVAYLGGRDLRTWPALHHAPHSYVQFAHLACIAYLGFCLAGLWAASAQPVAAPATPIAFRQVVGQLLHTGLVTFLAAGAGFASPVDLRPHLCRALQYLAFLGLPIPHSWQYTAQEPSDS